MIRLISDLFQDLRHGARVLAKAPGFTLIAVLSLGLGIGAGTAVFSLVNAIVLASLPVPNPHELRVLHWIGTEKGVAIFKNYSGNVESLTPGNTMMFRGAGHDRWTGDAFSHPIFAQLREQCAGQAEVFAFAENEETSIRARREAAIYKGLMVTDNFLSGLGVRPLIGRVFGPQDATPGAPPVVVIGYRLWQREFNLDPEALGHTIQINGHAFTVAGVLPEGFTGVNYGAVADYYLPLAAQTVLEPSFKLDDPENGYLHLLARLKPGVSGAQFAAAINTAFARAGSSVLKDPEILIKAGRGGWSSDAKAYGKSLFLLLGIVGIVILVACANLAGLSLARGAARGHEFAVRAAIGAGRGRLVRMALTENLLLALLGGGLGILLAQWIKGPLLRLLMANSIHNPHYDPRMDLTVLGFALAVTLITALLTGLLPALAAARIHPVAGLRERSATGAPRLGFGRALIVGQIALSLLLLTGAGLYGRTLKNLSDLDPGFSIENLLVFHMKPAASGYKREVLRNFYDNAQMALAGIPGVRSATIMEVAMLNVWHSGGAFFSLPGRSFDRNHPPEAHRQTIGDSFFSTLNIPIRQGRAFSPADGPSSAKVVIVNETFVRKYLSGINPLGQNLTIGNKEWSIVGVCGDIRDTDVKIEAPPMIYLSLRQKPMTGAFFAVCTALPPMAIVPAVRRALAAIDPNVPMFDITTQRQLRDDRISQERLFATLCGALSLLAVLLACIGLYGLMAYNARRRTSEIGIRMALGATPKDVLRTFLREASMLVAIGLGFGVPLSLILARLIRANLYGVGPADPATLIGAAALMLTVALLAAWIPSRRAARLDPMQALRME